MRVQDYYENTDDSTNSNPLQAGAAHTRAIETGRNFRVLQPEIHRLLQKVVNR
jgi:hypothetical protein